MLAPLVAALALTPLLPPRGTPPGTVVRPPRLDASIEVDGRLDEPAWTSAARLAGFARYQPTEGEPADSTVVLVWYSATAIHFGIRAYESHGAANATLADRDHIFSDDNVQLFLDTYHDGRQAIVLGVNPLGVQGDGTLVESGRSGGGFAASAVGGREPTDLSPDFVFQSKGRLTPWGYEVEVRVPFKSLRYQSADVQTWGLQVVRQIQHAGEEDTWAAAKRDAASFLGQSGVLADLSELHRGLVMDVTPELTQRWDGQGAGTRWAYDAAQWRLGGTVRWGVTENLTLNGTVRPDFSQVEADAGQIQFDPRVALYYAERRPFFLDGLEFFSAPNNLIYTRALVQPDAAVKLTGKAASTNLGLIAGLDGRDYSLAGDERPRVLMTRVQRDIGRSSRLGLVYTDRAEAAGSNRVLGVDGRYVFGGVYAAQFQVAGSRTAAGGATTEAPLWQARFIRSGRRVGFRTTFAGVSDRFETWSGFIGRPGIVQWNIDPNYTWSFAPDRFVQRLTADVVLDGTWQYQHFIHGTGIQDRKLHLNATALLRGGWTVATGWFIEQFGYDDQLYAPYRIVGDTGAGVVDTVAFTGTPTIPNSEVFVQVNTPQFQRVNAFGFALYGHDENFYEWSSAWLWVGQLGVNWRPTDQVRLGATYDWQRVDRRSDGSTVNVTQIPRVTLEYQVSRPLFVRLIGQYIRTDTDSLRDDSRTGLPLYRDTGSGLVRAGPRTVNDVRLDALVSYRPTPGTVLFVGYGSSYDAAGAYRLTDLDRRADGFFVKLSYLFRA
ncbi:MAG TPA: DUF5916 domain-containing protein [Gemmatimonadales bacterium]|nr:DUF5916 domain-containing protein [Gemmatimonadales bacterium]